MEKCCLKGNKRSKDKIFNWSCIKFYLNIHMQVNNNAGVERELEKEDKWGIIMWKVPIEKRLNTLTYVGVGMYSRVEVVISSNQVF